MHWWQILCLNCNVRPHFLPLLCSTLFRSLRVHSGFCARTWLVHACCCRWMQKHECLCKSMISRSPGKTFVLWGESCWLEETDALTVWGEAAVIGNFEGRFRLLRLTKLHCGSNMRVYLNHICLRFGKQKKVIVFCAVVEILTTVSGLF